MKRFVITIGREFGCNASEVGRQLAAKLGVHFYEKELVVKAAALVGIDENAISNPDRKIKNDINHMADYYVNEFGYGIQSSYFSEKAIEAQAYVIRQIANSESCVMFGRCANYFLSEFNNTLNVFLYAPLEFRIRHVHEAYKLTQIASEKLIKKIDKKRHSYYKYVTGKNRGDRHGRNLMIDMQMFSVEDAVDLIYSAAKKRFEIE